MALPMERGCGKAIPGTRNSPPCSQVDAPDWFKDKLRAAEILKQLSRLCAYYLSTPSRKTSLSTGWRGFSLGNGARLERLNWLGDISRPRACAARPGSW